VAALAFLGERLQSLALTLVSLLAKGVAAGSREGGLDGVGWAGPGRAP